MSTAQTTEIFRPVPGFPLYRVSDWGRVQSCDIPGLHGISDQWHDLKPTINPKDGYCYIGFSRNGKRYVRKVHRLVLEAFVGPCPDGMECCHFPDIDRTNNRLTNLRWDTIENNRADRLVHGTDNRGSRNVQARLTEVEVIEIRRLGSEGAGHQEIASRFGVSRANVSLILHRKIWSHLDDGYPAIRRRMSPGSVCFRPVPASDPVDRREAKGSKLRAEDIPVIRSLCDQGLKYSEIAARFSVDPSLIGMINRGEAWINVR